MRISALISLKDSAENMLPGQWLTIPMRIDTVGTGDIFAFSSKAVWEPRTNQILFLGAGYSHRVWNFLRYESDNDLWIHDFNLGFDSMSAANPPSGATHSYQNVTVDTAGVMYYNGYDSLYRYNTLTQTWLPAYAKAGSNRFGSLEYFPEMNCLTYVVAGTVRLFNFSTLTWQTHAANIPMGRSYDNVSEYDPVNHCLVFGGGETYGLPADQDTGLKILHRLDADGGITRLKDAPVAVTNYLGAHIVCDESSGTMLFQGLDSLYALDPVGNTWSNLGPNPGVRGGVTFHIREYGVVGFMPVTPYSFRDIVLYKYDASGSAVGRRNQPAPHAAPFISAQPNPFTSSTTITLPEKGLISIYNAAGRKVAQAEGTRYAWNTAGLAAGLYVVRAGAGGRTLTRNVLLIK